MGCEVEALRFVGEVRGVRVSSSAEELSSSSSELASSSSSESTSMREEVEATEEAREGDWGRRGARATEGLEGEREEGAVFCLLFGVFLGVASWRTAFFPLLARS